MSADDSAVAYEAFEDILAHLDTHVKAGRIRHVGVSNETAWGVMRFLAESDARRLPRIVSIQNAYSLVNRKFEEGLDEIALREQVGLLAYSPLAQGYLSGKYRGGVTPPGSRKALFERLGRYEKPGAEEAINAYLDLAAARGLDPAQMAIRFCDTRAFMTSTIIGATSMEQLRTNVAAFSMPWDRDLERAIHEIHNRNPSPCP